MATEQKVDQDAKKLIGQQSLLTKFFRPLNPSSDRPYFEFLFEKEEADRKKREEEAKRKHLEELRQRAEARRLSRIEAKKKKDEQRRLLDEESRKKYEGKEIIPGLFLGNRLAALNSDWLRNNVAFIVNAAGELRNYYERQKIEKKDQSKTLKNSKQSKSADTSDATLNQGKLKPISSQQQLDSTTKEGEETVLEEDLEKVEEEINQLEKELGATESELEDQEKDPELEGFVVDDDLPDKVPSQENEEETSEVELALSEELQLEYMKINAEDGIEQNMAQYFETAAEFIENAIQKFLKEDEEYQKLLLVVREEKKKLEEEKSKETKPNEVATETDQIDVAPVTKDPEESLKRPRGVLVHCREGMSRSPTIIIAFLMLRRSMDLYTAFTLVNEKNGKLNVNHGFLKQLMELEKKLFKKNTIDFFNKASRRNGVYAVAITEEEEKPKVATPRRRRLKKNVQIETEEPKVETNKDQMDLDSLIEETAPKVAVEDSRPADLLKDSSESKKSEEIEETVNKPSIVKEPEPDPKDSIQTISQTKKEEENSDKIVSKSEEESPSKPVVEEEETNESKQSISDDSKDELSESSSRKRKIDSLDEIASEQKDEIKKQKQSNSTPKKNENKSPKKIKGPLQKNTLMSYFGKM